MHYLTDFKDRLIEALLYSALVRVLFSITVISLVFATTWMDPYHPQPAWLGTAVYTLSSCAWIIYIYPETWR